MIGIKELESAADRYRKEICRLVEVMGRKNNRDRFYLYEMILTKYKHIVYSLEGQIIELKKLEELDKAIDMGQLFWELYNKYNNEGYRLYKSKEDLLNQSYFPTFSGIEVCRHWGRATVFGIDKARVELPKIVELAKGYLVKVTLQKTFRWEAKEGKPKRCRDGWQLFISPSESPFDEVLDFDNWLPPYDDDRFDCNLEIGVGNWSYTFKWIDGVYTFIASVYSKEAIKGFKDIFPEFLAEVSGSPTKGWVIKIPIYKR